MAFGIDSIPRLKQKALDFVVSFCAMLHHQLGFRKSMFHQNSVENKGNQALFMQIRLTTLFIY
jgi:hypothetical protein